MATGKVFTGCRARFKLNGKTIGHATGVSFREVVNYEPVNVLDDIAVKEHAPTGYDVSGSANFVRIVDDSLTAQGLLARKGTTTADFLTNLLALGELSAQLIDSQTGKNLAVVEGVRISEHGIDVQARSIVGINVSMVARIIKDEAET